MYQLHSRKNSVVTREVGPRDLWAMERALTKFKKLGYIKSLGVGGHPLLIPDWVLPSGNHIHNHAEMYL